MTKRANGFIRISRYTAVSLLGLAVKFSILAVLVEFAQLGYLIATAIAVESTILHNFSWHLLWTWGDRTAGISFLGILRRLLFFQAANGVVGLLVNLALMYLFVNSLGMHYSIANLAATLAAGCANYLLSDYFVFV
jgi:putative flippase GtrA